MRSTESPRAWGGPDFSRGVSRWAGEPQGGALNMTGSLRPKTQLRPPLRPNSATLAGGGAYSQRGLENMVTVPWPGRGPKEEHWCLWCLLPGHSASQVTQKGQLLGKVHGKAIGARSRGPAATAQQRKQLSLPLFSGTEHGTRAEALQAAEDQNHQVLI